MSRDTFFQNKEDKKTSVAESESHHDDVMTVLTQSEETFNSVGAVLTGINQTIINNNGKPDETKIKNNALIIQTLALAEASANTLHDKIIKETKEALVTRK